MTSFIIVLIGSILALSTSYVMLEHDPTVDIDNQGADFENSLWQIYNLFFGNMTIGINNIWENILYVVATFFLSLVMMNLIVALMSDTYNNVMTNI